MSEPGQLHAQEAALAAAMRLAQAGDPNAYRELLEAVTVLLQIYASRSLKRMGIHDESSVDDLVQETLLALHAKRHTYDSAQLFTPWLFAIARYKVIDFGRSRRRRGPTVDIQQLEEVLEAPVFSEPTTQADLKLLISKLPEKSRRVLELVKLEGLSIAEAAARTQMSESAIKVSVHRAVKSLRNMLTKKTSK